MKKRYTIYVLVMILSFVSMSIILGGCSKASSDQSEDRIKCTDKISKEDVEEIEENSEKSGSEDDSLLKEETAKDNSSDKKLQEESSEKKGSAYDKTSAAGNGNQSKGVSTPKDVNANGKQENQGKKWIPAHNETIYHPAEIKQVKYIEYYTCQCGQIFKNKTLWQEHRPDPCNGKHTYADPKIGTRDKIVREAWTEIVEVPGHWE